MQDQRIYARLTTVSVFDANETNHPGYTGFRPLFQGEITYDGNGWHEIEFSSTFTWDGVQNIEFLFENQRGEHTISGYPTFIYTNYNGFNYGVYRSADDEFPLTGGTLTTQRPDTQLITPTATPPATAHLASPMNGGTMISVTPILSWEEVDGADGFKLSLWKEDPAPIYVEEERDLGSILNYKISIPLEYETTYYWQVIPYNMYGDATNCPVWSFTTTQEGILTLGEGTYAQRFPMGSYYGYERSAALYPASFFADKNINITSLGWYATLDTYVSIPTKIYLKTYPSTTLPNTIWSELLVGASLVYDQNQFGMDSNNWNTIALDESFDLDAGNNLLVLIERNYGGGGNGTMAGAGIYSTPVTNQHLTWATDGYEAGGLGAINIHRPNLMVVGTEYEITTVPNPAAIISPADEYNMVDLGSSLKWISGGGGPSGYKMYLGTDNPPTNITNGLDLGDQTSWTLPTLQSGTIYYWKVVPYNGYGDAINSPVWSFRTLPEWVLTIGSGDLASSYPFDTGWEDSRTQMLFSADELVAAGASPFQPLEGLAFDAVNLSSITMNDILIRVKQTNVHSLTGFDTSDDFETCYLASHAMGSTGWNYFMFTTPFIWDGDANLLIDISFNNSDWTMEVNKVNATVIPGMTWAYSRNEANGATLTGGAPQNNRPNTRFVLMDPPSGPPVAPLLVSPLDGSSGLPIEGFDLTWTPDLANGNMPQYYVVYLSRDEDPIANSEVVEEIHQGRSWNPVVDGGVEFGYSERWYWAVGAASFVDDVYYEELSEVRWFALVASPPQISVSHTSISEMLAVGESTTAVLALTNAGGLPLSYSIGFVENQSRSAILPYDPANPIIQNQNASLRVDSEPFIGPVTAVQSRNRFDLQFNYALLGSEYGVTTDGTYLYTSHWETPGKIGKYELDGTSLGTFIIPGAGQIRDMTYDGRYFYGAANSPQIYEMDFNTGTLMGTITSPFVNTRGIAYDPDNDGFWITNAWSTTSALIDRSGQIVRSLTLGGASNGGLAYDNVSGTEPTLWGNAETTPNYNNITQYSLTNGAILQVFNAVDVIPEIANDSDIAGGGMDLAIGLVPGKASLICVAQGLSFYGLELSDVDFWLNYSPSAGVVLPGDRVDVNIQLNAQGRQPGLYSGNLVIYHNADLEPVQTPVSLIVTGTEADIVPVTDLSISLSGNDYISLNWSAVPGADWYILYVSDDPYGEYAAFGYVEQAGVLNIPTDQLGQNKAFIKVEAGVGSAPQIRRLSSSPAK